MNPAPFLVALLLAAASALAVSKPLQTLEGKVIGIADGDTITVLDDTKTQHKVRLFGIDAPELRQPYSQLAKSALSKKVYAKRVSVKWRDKDRYGRILGAVAVNGKNVNRELVAEGWAWHFVRYSSSKSLAEAELAAREQQVGLWSGEDPVAPWDWRKQEAERRAELTKRPPPEPAPPAEDVKVEALVVRPPGRTARGECCVGDGLRDDNGHEVSSGRLSVVGKVEQSDAARRGQGSLFSLQALRPTAMKPVIFSIHSDGWTWHLHCLQSRFERPMRVNHVRSNLSCCERPLGVDRHGGASSRRRAYRVRGVAQGLSAERLKMARPAVRRRAISATARPRRSVPA